MAERTEELRRDIEQTRTHMSGTLDEIGDRVSPGRIAERKWESVRDSGARVAATVMGAPRTAAQRTGNAVSGVQGSAGDTAASAAHSVAEAPDRIKDAASGNPLAAGAVALGLGVLLGSLVAPSPEEQRVAEQLVEPVQAGLSDAGQQLAGAIKTQVTDEMAPVMEHATEAVAEVKQHAVESTETVRSEASSATDTVKHDVSDASTSVRD